MRLARATRRRMRDAVQVQGGTGIRFVAAMILFLNGWIFALPVAENMPRWATPIQVVHGVFLHEALFVVYFAAFFLLRGAALPLPPRGILGITGLIVFLGLLSMLSAGVNGNPVREVIGAGRYLLLAVYFMMTAYWAGRLGTTFVLRWFLAGLTLAGAVNIYFAFLGVAGRLGSLPLLVGQNGPGGHLGIAVVLSAWLVLQAVSVSDRIVAATTAVVALFGASISYSKLAMLMAAAGAFAWLFILLRNVDVRRARAVGLLVLALIVTFGVVKRDALVAYARGVDTFIEYKFRHLDTASVMARARYFLITGEILTQHPLLGVGEGGFYAAAVTTNAYRRWPGNPEDAGAGRRGESNPHSSFLLHTAAVGIAGLVFGLVMFLTATLAFGRALAGRGLAGRVTWLSLTFAYLLFGLTLPTLFNTSILYVPLAVAMQTGSVSALFLPVERRAKAVTSGLRTAPIRRPFSR